VQNNDITCEFFLEAVKSDKHGWFWKCPNGDECIYRHALPEGFEFKKEEVKVEDDDEEKPVFEAELDKDRSNLPTGQKNVTFEEFMAWVEEDKRIRELEKMESRKHLKGISGKEMFESNQALFQDDDDAFEEYQRDEEPQEEEEEDKRFVDESALGRVEEEKVEEEKVHEGKEIKEHTGVSESNEEKLVNVEKHE
jgi:ssDNA-binding Zn-finger/Zn-ribbon topoisomerase 1